MLLFAAFAAAAPLRLNVSVDGEAGESSSIMYGLFFEDINMAADGGLYAELVRNRSFEFNDEDALFAWESELDMSVEKENPLNENNPHYLSLKTTGGKPLRNKGFDGIALEQGKTYLFSCYARSEAVNRMEVSLVTSEGRRVASERTSRINAEWKKFEFKLVSRVSDKKAALEIRFAGEGEVFLDMVSLFPQDTWKNQPNGLRKDLVEALAELKPAFIRFPGGCIVEGMELWNAYRWKDTVGDVAGRKVNWNRWSTWNAPKQYYQSCGLGFFEYFRLCDDLGAEPVPILNCGMACQYQSGELVPLDELDEWIQDALDLIEFANGDTSTKWGGLRAEMGHPEPFNMKLLGIGNEQWGEQYFERYEKFYEVLKAKHPEIQYITTSGPSSDGDSFDLAWSKFKQGTPAEIVDEHYYRPPSWFLANNARYDSYDRNGPKVFAGEFAAHQGNRKNDLGAAVAEASFMCSLDRNSDIVCMASYAPLFARYGFTQWAPDLIFFNESTVVRTPSYYVQQLFSLHKGDYILESELTGSKPEQGANVFALRSWLTANEFKDITLTTESGKKLTSSDLKWEFVSGEWERNGDVFAQTDPRAQNTICMASAEDVGEKFTIEMKARAVSGAEGFMILLPSDARDKGVQLNIGGWGNGQNAMQLVNGSTSSILKRESGKIERGQWYDVKIVSDNGVVTSYLDGRELWQTASIVSKSVSNGVYSSTMKRKNGDVIIKLVNTTEEPRNIEISLDTKDAYSNVCDVWTLSGESGKANTPEATPVPAPARSRYNAAGNDFTYLAMPNTVNVIELKKAVSPEAKGGYLFSYFTGNGEDGLHLISSYDGLKWEKVANGKSLLRPELGDKLMRDPCVVQGPDGEFHMVWTTGWHGKGIGLAHSKDLISWSKQQFVPVMAHESGAKNCWAPEILYDEATGEYVIYWATTIEGRFPETFNPQDDNNHRIYAVRTKDFKTYSDTELFYEPGFNVIDSTILPTLDGEKFVMFLKNETKAPRAEKNIRYAFGQTPSGPFGKESEPISGKGWAEGPTAINIAGKCYLYYDRYTSGNYGLRISTNYSDWSDATSLLELPVKLKHGTIFEVGGDVLENLKKQ